MTVSPSSGVREHSSKVFIVGNSRSGTTLMAKMLGNHPAILRGRELHFFEGLYLPATSSNVRLSLADSIELGSEILRRQRHGYLDTAHRAEELEDEVTQALSAVGCADFSAPEVLCALMDREARRAGKSGWCEQTPRNVFYVDDILAEIPNARIVHMVRDPRDVLLSQKGKWRRKSLGANSSYFESIRAWLNYHPIVMSLLWRSSVQAGLGQGESSSTILVKFEDLLAAPESEIRRVTEFLGLGYDRGMLEVEHSGSSVIADGTTQGVSGDAAMRWRSNRDAAAIYWCEKLCRPTMAELGYQPSGIRASVLARLGTMISMPVKLVGALLLNVQRYKNVLRAVTRRLTS